MSSLITQIAEHPLQDRGGFTKHYLTLFSIAVGMNAQRVLEIGGGTSTPVLLEALNHTNGKLVTCDPRDLSGIGCDDEFAKKNPHWTFVQKYSFEYIPTITEEFDIVLHDGSHEGKVLFKDLRKLLPHIRKGGILLVHDTNHPKLKNLLRATRLALLGCRHEKITLPYGNGLTIIIKK